VPRYGVYARSQQLSTDVLRPVNCRCVNSLVRVRYHGDQTGVDERLCRLTGSPTCTAVSFELPRTRNVVSGLHSQLRPAKDGRGKTNIWTSERLL
jgi:hypothetical protein